MLYKSTPEGAREFLVPSRIHHGQFYALPQSPQLFKQMLMIAGFDRYYQIVKCFRDEDLRADRQPEFTQIDIETSFLDELEIREIMEGLVRTMFRDALDVELPDPFPVMTYADAMRDYGSDKPDLRVPLKLTELTDLMKTRRLQGLPRGGRPPERTRRRAARARRRRRCRARRSTTTRRSWRSTAPRASPTSRSTTRRSRRGRACSRRSSSSSPPSVLQRDPRAHRRADRRPDLLRRRPGEGRQRRARRAAREGRPRPRARGQRLEAAVGRRLPDVRVRRRGEDLGRAPPSVHRAEGRPRGPVRDRPGQARSPRPTTSC